MAPKIIFLFHSIKRLVDNVEVKQWGVRVSVEQFEKFLFQLEIQRLNETGALGGPSSNLQKLGKPKKIF